MLYLDEPIGIIDGLVIFRDHENQSLFHFARERPRIARNDGVPEFIFLKYRRDITDNPDFDPENPDSLGGGFLAFTVDLGSEQTELDAVKRKLGPFAGDGPVQLAPIQFRKGSVRLSITKDAAEEEDAPPELAGGQSFFEEVYGTTMPSLFGFNRATFSVLLSQEGATLVEAALRAGISPIGVIYQLEYLGLRPAFNVRITADYKRVYTHLETEFGARGQIYAVSVAADIAAAFQKLRDEGVVKVEVLTFSDDEDLRKQADDAFNWFKTELLKDFFQSALEPPSFMRPQAGGLGLLGQLQGLFGSLAPQTTTSATPVRGAPSQAAPTNPPNPQGSSPDAVASSTDINRAGAAARSGGGGGGGGGSGGGGANPISPFQVAFSLKVYRQEELKTRVFEYSAQAAVAREMAPQGLFSTIVDGLDLDRVIKEVNLDDDFFKRLVATVTVGGDLQSVAIDAVAVNLEYPADWQERRLGAPLHVGGFIFRPGESTSHTFTTWLDEERTLDYRYQMDIHFKPDSPWVGKEAHVTTDWVTTRARQLTLNPLDAVDLLDVELQLGDMDSGEVSQVQAELHYRDDASDFEVQKTFLLKPGDPPKRWQLRLPQAGVASYRYRVTYFLASNLQFRSDWQESSDGSLVINEPFRDTLRIRLVPNLDASELLEAVIDLGYNEESTGYTRRLQEVFTQAEPLTSRNITIPTLVEGPRRYTYEATIIRNDGSVFSSGQQVREVSAAVVSDGEGQTHRIKVRMPDANTSLGPLAAIKVDLVGPGDAPDADSCIFTPSQMADKELSLVQPDAGNSFRYRYTITGYTSLGQPVPGETNVTSDPTLIVRLPTVEA